MNTESARGSASYRGDTTTPVGACLQAKPLPAPDSGRGFACKQAPTGQNR